MLCGGYKKELDPDVTSDLNVGVEAAVKIGTKENVPGAGIREAGWRNRARAASLTIGWAC